jgi:hypothetical protein
MKWKTVTLSAVLSVSALISQFGFAEVPNPFPRLVSMPAQYIFAPPGFDNNDNAQIVIYGQLPSTCYKAANPAVRVDPNTHRIYVSVVAYAYSGCFCLEVMTPFTHTVDLGILPAGNYQIYEADANGASSPRGMMPIAATQTPMPDENLYAPVRSAIIEKHGNQSMLHLSGVFTSDCIDLQRVVTLHRASRIIEVLPLAIQKPGVVCTRRNRPFEARVALSASEAGENLIHILSMNGNSVNLVEEF